MTRPIRVAVFAFCAVLAPPVAAQDFDAGLDAYEHGDYATALENIEPLAEQGNMLAQSVLGEMYRAGRGVPQDHLEAARWYRLAAAQGEVIAQANLGVMYESGLGVPQDGAEAVRWYRMAAEQGEAFAQANLGQMYAIGEGVTQDNAEAVRWYRMAAEQGDALAQASLGFMYLNGRGVPQDYVLAHMWSNIASANGNEPGAENRGISESFMTREQIADAQARARVCLSSGYQDCD